ncbi:MAG: UDP-N-acetylmuramoyl-L-alanine--D-glutamate ligase [Gammaproteobacteria bacterium]|nr:UDP-N-acetylmuramoyl-L-alanine--D-glutamate ligase [Gammaproteobacteria bacterium]
MKQPVDLVMGLGVTGYSVVEFLHNKRAVLVCDTRSGRDSQFIPRLQQLRSTYPNVRVVPPKQINKVLSQVSRIIASPGIPMSHTLLQLAKLRNIPVLGDLDLFMDEVKVPVIAITGTNGKSTTVALLQAMLSDKGIVACGNIGTPALEALSLDASGYILELSSFQLERSKPAEFDAACVLNVSMDHLDHHRSMEEYIAAKQCIYKKCKLAVFDSTEAYTTPPEGVPFIALNQNHNWCMEDNAIVVDGQQISRHEIALQNDYDLKNLLVASAIAQIFGASMEKIRSVAASFGGLPHRAQVVGVFDGVKYVNDSKATNVAAAVASIRANRPFDNNLILIAGGTAKGSHFEILGTNIDKYVSHALLFGADSHHIAEHVHSAPCSIASSLAEAIQQCRELSQSGDTVLLAPACSSTDMFANFEERGRIFEQLVRSSAL